MPAATSSGGDAAAAVQFPLDTIKLKQQLRGSALRGPICVLREARARAASPAASNAFFVG